MGLGALRIADIKLKDPGNFGANILGVLCPKRNPIGMISNNKFFQILKFSHSRATSKIPLKINPSAPHPHRVENLKFSRGRCSNIWLFIKYFMIQILILMVYQF